MSRAQRIALLGAAAAVLIAVFLLTRGDDEPSATAQTTTATQPAQPTTTPVAANTTTTDAPPVKVKPRAHPKPDLGPLLTAAEVTDLKTRVGETVRFRVRSAETDEVHVHGYDRSFEAPAGKIVNVKLKATIPGIFEIELEQAGAPIAKLEVQE